MNKKTKPFILALIIVIIILFIISVLPPGAPPTEPRPTPSPAIAPQGDSGVLEKQEEIRTNQYPLIDKTPYRTALFEVSYIGPLKLKVLMLDKDEEKIKNEVEKWLRGNGVNPESHQIEFTTPQLP